MAAFISFTSFLSFVHFSASARAPALPVIFCSSFRMYALACFVSAACCFSSTLRLVAVGGVGGGVAKGSVKGSVRSW